MLCPLALAIASASTMADGRIEGRVSDQTGQAYFDGAIVQLLDANGNTNIAKVSTDDSGRFTFNRVPAGEYSMVVDYIGADPVTTSLVVTDNQTTQSMVKIGEQKRLVENTIVFGQRAQISSELNKQRTADTVKSVVSADSIGQFPDSNVSEALQRVSGVFIERDQGEGRFVGIRGINPNLNSATINGVNIPSPENDSRSVALDVIPSDLLQSLEVTKSVTPDMDGDSIGGSIEVKSLTAFDREGLTYSFSAEGGYNELVSETSPKLAGTFTNVFDLSDGGELGVAMALSWQERKFGSDNIEVDGGWKDDIEDSGERGIEEIEHRDYIIERERLGMAFNIDWRPSDLSQYYVRTLRSEFEDSEVRQRVEFKLEDGDLDSITADSATWVNAEMDRDLKDRYEAQEITSIVAGGENIVNDWTVEYALGYAKAEEAEPNRRDTGFRRKDIAEMGYSSLGQRPTLFASADAYDASGFELDDVVVENNITDDTETSFRFDITRDVDFGAFPGEIQFGGKFRRRDKMKDVDVAVYEGFPEDLTLDQVALTSVDYGIANFGPGVDMGLLNQWIDSNISQFELNTEDSILDSARDYDITEDINAAYVMTRLDMDDLMVVMGLRYEDTDFEARGFNAVNVDGDPAIEANQFSKSYDHVLPSINVRYKWGDDVVVRAALSQTIARPSFGDASPSPEAIDIDDDGELEIEAGNPLLDPYESFNADLSIAYYMGDIGVLGAGVFYKDIDNFIYTADVSDSVELTQFVGPRVITDAEVLQSLNGNNAKLTGLEFNYTKQFTELPGAWSGLMLQLNATLTDSEATLDQLDSDDRNLNISMPDQADRVGNLVLGYEYEGLSLRLSAAHKSERLKEIDLGDATNDLYQSSHTQIDFSAKYNVSDSTQLYFNAINLSDEPFYNYHGSRSYNGQYEEYGQSFVFGFSYRNL